MWTDVFILSDPFCQFVIQKHCPMNYFALVIFTELRDQLNLKYSFIITIPGPVTEFQLS